VRNPSNKGPGATRNLGLKHSLGKYIGFVDDDMYVDKDWIKNAVKYFGSEKIAGVTGKVEIPDKKLVTPFTHQSENLGGKNLFTGAGNVFYLKSAIMEVGGFDPAFYDCIKKIHFREDSDLAFKILEKKYEIVFAEDVIAYHPPVKIGYWGPIKIAKKCYFDPLLFLKHPTMFKKYEKHSIYPKYRLYYFCLAIMLISLLLQNRIISLLSIIFFLGSVFLLLYKACKGRFGFFTKEFPIALIIYTFVPLFFLFSLLRGNLKFKTFVW
jgi:glycosyltransferase involved in cell wall biosynthesis